MYKMRGIQNSNFRTQMRYCSHRFKLPRKKFSRQFEAARC